MKEEIDNTKENKNHREIKVIPTVMPDSVRDFKDKIDFVRRHVDTIQIDVMDGKYVPSKSWPYKNENEKYWQALTIQDEGLPYWEKIDYEVDLMVRDQLEEAIKWIDAGVCRVIGHYGAFKNEQEILEFIDLKNSLNVEVYLAITPDEDNSVLDPFIDKIDGVQFMGIRQVGYQGQPFAEITLEKISQLRKKYPEITISVDGGVSLETAGDLIDAGADNLSSGSTIFNSTNIEKTIYELENA